MVKIAPSLLSADFLHLEKDVRMCCNNADFLHLDIMDGVFVPNISYGFPVVEAISEIATIPMDVHLMIADPGKYISRFAKCGAKMVSFHLEAAGDKTQEVIDLIRYLGMSPGVVINPDLPVSSLYPYLESVDYVLLMSVFAGFGGQKFIEDTYERVCTLKDEIDRRRLDVEIEVDGGVSPSNAPALIKAGASILVAGSSVFKSEDPAATIEAMRQII